MTHRVVKIRHGFKPQWKGWFFWHDYRMNGSVQIFFGLEDAKNLIFLLAERTGEGVQVWP